MYIDELRIENFRCFAKQSVKFMHPDLSRAGGVRFPNINVVLGANGVGKTTLLRAVALVTLNPLIGQSGYKPNSLIRQLPQKESRHYEPHHPRKTVLHGFSKLHQELAFDVDKYDDNFEVKLTIKKIDDEEIITTPQIDQLFNTKGDSIHIGNTSLFAVAYGAMRRVERLPSYELEAQNRQYSYRYSRMANLFDSRVVLTSLVSWLPQLPKREKKQILEIFASLMPDKLEFSDSIDGHEFSFYHNKILVPFDALADGHRSYIGWVSDLLYHLHRANPKNILDVHGVVLVDEVDLLAHPTWQRTLVPTLSKTFPKLQFILTTHSPIVAASVEAVNLFILEPTSNGTAKLTRPDAEVYGLNAQQVLHKVFGMESTRAKGFEDKLKSLARQSRSGNAKATEDLMQGLAYGAGKPIPFEDVDLDIEKMQIAAKTLLESKQS